MSATRVIFFGTPDFAVQTLEALLAHRDQFQILAVVTQPDRPAGRGSKVQPSPVKECAMRNKIPVLQPFSIKKELATFLESAAVFGPFDIGVVVAFGQILPQAVLDLPAKGCVNTHGSILPRWRGAAPIQRAILAGDTVTGVDLMHMEQGLDTGAVFSSVHIPIEPSDDFGSLHNKLAQAAGKLLVKDLALIAAGKITPQPQDDSKATHAAKIKNEEAKIDWNRSAKEISLLIRGLSPAPGAFALYGGQRVKIFKALPLEKPMTGSAQGKTPGSIVMLDTGRLEIQCGQGVLSVEEAQLEGRRRMPIEELLRGSPFSSNALFQ